jgi:exodeoxyribonuclease VII large subunit
MSTLGRAPLDVETYSVSQLGRELCDLLRSSYPAVWVVGEVQRFKVHASGHCYFELVEKGETDGIVGKLDAVLFRGDAARVRARLERHGLRLADGLEIRCRVAVDFYPPQGRLQVQVKDVDPVFALGALAQRREQTLAALAAAGRLEANRARTLAALPLHVALVTSEGSAAYHDFLATLTESGFGFRVTFVHAAVQGAEAEAAIVSALELAVRAGVDCIALVRGGGAKSDLAAFDGRALAFAVADAAVPVLTGLGHEIDESVVDRVAHTAFKTPTKVAEFLVARLLGAEQATDRLRGRLLAAGRLRLASAGNRLGRAERRFDAARGRLRALGSRVAALAGALASSAPLYCRAATARIDGLARLVAGFSPERTLARGFSITRGEGGHALRSADQVAPGQRIVTRLAHGSVASRIEERSAR